MAGTWSFVGRNVGMATYGKEFGNSHPDSPDFSRVVSLAEKDFGGPVCILRVGFKNDQILDLGDPAQRGALIEGTASCRPIIVADGAFLPYGDPIKALAICNADCPIICCIVSQNGVLNGFILTHAGRDNLIPQNGPSIIQTLRDWLTQCGYNLKAILIGAGIRSCCYGCDSATVTPLVSKYCDPKYLLTQAVKGPRAGQPSLRIKHLAMVQVYHFLPRIDPSYFNVDWRCTACAQGPDGQRLFWSNVYDRDDPDPLRAKGRNLTVFGWRP